MITLTVTAKGQVTLRRELLDHMGVRPGDKITLEKSPGRALTVKPATRGRKIEDLFGMLKRRDGPSLTIEEMNEVIAAGWAGET